MSLRMTGRSTFIGSALLALTLSPGACARPMTAPLLSPAVPGVAIPRSAADAPPLIRAESLADDPAGGGSGPLGREIQADNRDCPEGGARGRDISVPSAQGAPSCAPTGAAPGSGETPPVPASSPEAGTVTPSGPSGASPFAPENR
jgi:hypothetical protein